MQIEVKSEFEAISIFINGTLHLWLDKTKLLGIHSWIKTGRKQFFIEFIMENGNITVDYDNIKKWEEILKQLYFIITIGK